MARTSPAWGVPGGLPKCIEMGRGNVPSKDIAGQTFAQLRALYPAGQNKHRKTMWRCLCDCGQETTALAGSLLSGNTKSCGCRKKPHGHGGANKSPTYRSWRSMHTRVSNPNADAYRWYGALGVAIDPRWDSFKTFLADMGERPEGTTLDRIDPDGNYEPGNCRWADGATQQANRRERVAA